MKTTVIAAENRADHTSFAMLMVLLGVSVVTVMDLVTKWISTDISLWQLLFMRSAFGLLLLLPLLLLLRQLPKARALNRKAVLIRSAIMGLAYITFFTSLAVLPIAIVAGSFFSAPLFMVILSRIMLREHVGVWRIASVLMGFIGVMLILHPDSAEFSFIFLLPVFAGFCYALTQVYTRKYCKNEDPLAISIFQTGIFLIIGLIGMAGLIMFPLAEQPGFLTFPLFLTGTLVTLIILGLAVGSLIMHFSLAAAYQNAPASLVGPLEYLYLPMAVVGGYLLFDEQPQTSALFGIVIIITAGLIIAWRERKLSTAM